MKENIETTEKILRKAHKEKRSTLFEHEVYGILKGWGSELRCTSSSVM